MKQFFEKRFLIVRHKPHRSLQKTWHRKIRHTTSTTRKRQDKYLIKNVTEQVKNFAFFFR